MNYCILNEKKSTLIKGLLIQSLPPISKPLVRTQIEEIDGRDGDIVTKLGYSAYDKEMSIGLFGDYDIDEVIEFFDSEGEVIFSNEPDKYYKYQILDQIDFERLIRFKTATVTFHCQPFKFSAVDDDFTISKNKIHPKPYTLSRYGVSVEVENGVVSVSGTATGQAEFYIPIQDMSLDGSYTLQADCDGSGYQNCFIRVIDENPSDADSFGGQMYQLGASIEATHTVDETYHYLWVYVSRGAVVDFDLYVQMLEDGFSNFKVFNRGNTFSRPTLTIYGSGNVALLINGVQVFTLNLSNGDYITLNASEMNAYKGNALMNRMVSGDFNNLKLKTGTNLISWVGNVTQVIVEDASRWI